MDNNNRELIVIGSEDIADLVSQILDEKGFVTREDIFTRIQESLKK